MKVASPSNLSSRVFRPIVGVAASASILSAVGCSSIKFYPGEERADSSIGRLLFNSTGADMRVITIDGIQHPHPGRTVEILPGPHSIEVKYQEQFETADAIVTNNSHHSDDQSGLAVTRFGTCSLRFTNEATQELFV